MARQRHGWRRALIQGDLRDPNLLCKLDRRKSDRRETPWVVLVALDWTADKSR
jgi:hypothetical protein